MERAEAVKRLKELVGKNLHDLAQDFEITVLSESGKINKGWAGHVCERHLGIPLNTSQSPNFGSWELKSIPLKYTKKGELVIKETMAITMIDPYQVVRTPFEESHLLAKLKKAVIVARTVGDTYVDPSYIHSVNIIDLDERLYEAVKQDYEAVQWQIDKKGFDTLSGRMGRYIQPRTKGVGHGSKTRAFYARKDFLRFFIIP